MMLIRNARKSDLDSIHKLTENFGIGMTSLPHNKELLQKRLKKIEESFHKSIVEPTNELYLFILEDPNSKQILGTSGIEAKTGFDSPLYSYHLEQYARSSPALNIQSEYEVLNLVNDNQEKTEICTLYLTPQYRNKHNGLLLSKARFLFMAQFPNRFCPVVIAEMRGFVDENNNAPFWDNVGHHFFKMSFDEVCELHSITNGQIIEDLMPQYPIYVPLLSTQTQEVIGKPHSAAVPARAILLREGFYFNKYVHIFDAGPTLECNLNEIKTVSLSQEYLISSVSDEVQGIDYLVSNTLIDFRATTACVFLNEQDRSCVINKDTAELLKVGIKDKLRLAPLKINDEVANR